MKKFLIILITLLSFEFQCYAEKTKGDELIGLELDQLKSSPKRHRAPLHLNVEAFYDAEANCIYVSGTCEAEVNLYLNGYLIDHSDEVNATFELPETNVYVCARLGDNWRGMTIKKPFKN